MGSDRDVLVEVLDCFNMLLSSRPTILITKRVFPETIALLGPHAELDYNATDEGLTPEELIARARGKQIDPKPAHRPAPPRCNRADL